MKRVTIIGKGPGWHEAPENGSEIWGLNDLILRRRVDVVFNMHDLDEILASTHDISDLPALEIQAYFARSVEVINEQSLPFFSVKEYANVPTSRRYPLEDMVSKYGDYFGSGIDYALAWAIDQGVAAIDLYGFVLEGHYDLHKASAEYWIGLGWGRGIEINVHGESRLLKTHNDLLYGFGIAQGSL